MDFLDYWKAIKARLDEEFAHRLPGFFSHLPEQQVESICRLLEGGKRVRGCLTCLTNGALGGRVEDAVPRALAIECIQAASLIHDDYVDGDTVRRDRAALWTVAGPRKAVLLGDVIFATALRNMVEMSREDGLAAAEAIATMAQGAYGEFLEAAEMACAVPAGPPRSAPYDRIIHLKTGALFGAAAKLGAISAEAPPRLCDLAFRYGASLGEAYQIADDLHDVVMPNTSPKISNARLVAWTPVFLRFAPDMAFPVASLLEGGGEEFQAWFHRAKPLLKARMGDEIKARMGLAEAAIKAFPENRHTAMLRAAPAEIVRMMRESGSTISVR